MRSHSGERPHQCDICSKRFFAASALKVRIPIFYFLQEVYTCQFDFTNELPIFYIGIGTQETS